MSGHVSRQQLLSDLSTGNQTQKLHIGPYERVRGLAYADDLSRAIKRLQVEVRSDTVSTCVRHLDDALCHANARARAMDAGDRARLCLIAVLERSYPHCEACNGVKEIKRPGMPVLRCDECHGSGIRRYTDQDRRRVFKRSLDAQDEAALNEALLLFAKHDTLGVGIARHRVYGDDE